MNSYVVKSLLRRRLSTEDLGMCKQRDMHVTKKCHALLKNRDTVKARDVFSNYLQIYCNILPSEMFFCIFKS